MIIIYRIKITFMWMDKKKEKEWFNWAKKHRSQVVKSIMFQYDSQEYQAKQIIFLAWSPWAWKTEMISWMLKSWFDEFFLHIDLDELRKLIPWYNWNNADSYQKWSIRIMEMLLDKAFKKSTNIILDWTFWSKCVTEKNLKRAISKWYNVQIFYVSFDPIIAWKYTLWRELENKRKIPFLSFFNQYYNSYKNIKNAFMNYEWIELVVLKKQLTKSWHSGKIYTMKKHNELLKNENQFKPLENKFLLFIQLWLITLKHKFNLLKSKLWTQQSKK